MNTRAFTLALIMAGFAAFLVYTYIDDKENALNSKYGTSITVVVAKEDIQELSLIDDTKVRVINVPQSFRSPGAFSAVREVENTVATVPILKGEQITKPRVTFPGAKTGLSRQVSQGKRAIAINITDRQAVSKLIKPGDRVDVIAVIDPSDGRKDLKMTKTILQDVLVLSTGQNMTNALPIIGVETPKVIRKMNLSTYSKFDTVTLELDPFQVQKLVLLIDLGKPPFLTLRNNNDKKMVRIKSTKIYDLLGEDAAEAKSFYSDKYKKK
jgi:pilus assembly protein CpaB